MVDSENSSVDKMGKVNPEILEVQRKLKESGIESFLSDFELSILGCSFEKMDGVIKHEGFPSAKISKEWKTLGRIGDLQVPEGDSEEILKQMIKIYEEKGFKLIRFDKTSGQILFKRQEEKREVNYSILGNISLIASFYTDFP